MTTDNNTLQAARSNKDDEYYTRLEYIEAEVGHYWKHFEGQTVFLNCGDNPTRNFWKYFHENFRAIGLKKLTATTYVPGGRGKLFTYDGVETVETELSGNGDFRSKECIRILDSSDIVVSNPPFSLFRDYLKQILAHGKKFLIVGSMNAATCKEVFRSIMENRVWWGCSTSGSARNMWFDCEDDYEPDNANNNYKVEDGVKMRKIQGIEWYTNLEHEARNVPLELVCQYNPDDYPEYDNYRAVEVSRVARIPSDYDGVMGVPVSFLDKHCPEQFEIVGITENSDNVSHLYIDGCEKYDRPYLGGKRMYSRILIRRRRQ